MKNCWKKKWCNPWTGTTNAKLPWRQYGGGVPGKQDLLPKVPAREEKKECIKQVANKEKMAKSRRKHYTIKTIDNLRHKDQFTSLEFIKEFKRVSGVDVPNSTLYRELKLAYLENKCIKFSDGIYGVPTAGAMDQKAPPQITQ